MKYLEHLANSHDQQSWKPDLPFFGPLEDWCYCNSLLIRSPRVVPAHNTPPSEAHLSMWQSRERWPKLTTSVAFPHAVAQSPAAKHEPSISKLELEPIKCNRFVETYWLLHPKYDPAKSIARCRIGAPNKQSTKNYGIKHLILYIP